MRSFSTRVVKHTAVNQHTKQPLLVVGGHAVTVHYATHEEPDAVHPYDVLIVSTPAVTVVGEEYGTNVSDLVLSPTLLQELRPELEAFLVSYLGKVHIVKIGLSECINADGQVVGDDEHPPIELVPASEDRTVRFRHLSDVADYQRQLWSDVAIPTDGAYFDPVAYTRRMGAATTSWEVVSVTMDDTGAVTALDITEMTGSGNKYQFRIVNNFGDTFVPVAGTVCVITAQGKYIWAVNTLLKDAVFKAYGVPEKKVTPAA